MARESSAPASFARDVVNTALTSVVTMAALVVVTRWMAAALSGSEFGVYGLSRRLASSVAIYSNVVGLSLARFVAMDEDPDRRDAFLLVALGCGLLPAMLLILLAALFPVAFAVAAFHDPGLGMAAVATAVLVLGTSAFNVAYAHFRGTGRVEVGNYWQVLVVAVFPVAIAARFASTRQIPLINALTGAGMALALLPLLGRMAAAALRPAVRAQLGERARDLLRYGLPRVPGGFAFGALIAVGPYLAPRYGGMEQAGYLVAGQSLLRIVEAGTAAFGVVALPRVASLLAKGHTVFVRDRVEDVISMAVHLGLLASIQLLVWSDVIVLAWLGQPYAVAIPVIRIMMLAAVPYLAYTILRSVVDALDERAVNTLNVLIALGVTIVGSIAAGMLGWSGQGLAGAGAIGLLVLGALSVRFVWISLRPTGRALALGRGAWYCLVASLPSALARAFMPAGMGTFSRLAIAGLAALVSTGLYVYLLSRGEVRWVGEVRTRMRSVLNRG